MLYKIFRIKDEGAINDFLELHKADIGEKRYWSDSKSRNIIFLFNNRFEPEVVGTNHMRSIWFARHKEACTKLAELQIDLMKLDQKDPEATVPSGEMVALGSHEMELSKQVNDVIANYVEAVKYWNNVKLDPESLLAGEAPQSLSDAFEK